MDTRPGLLSHGGCFQGGKALGMPQALPCAAPALCASMCIPVMCARTDLLIFAPVCFSVPLVASGEVQRGSEEDFKNRIEVRLAKLGHWDKSRKPPRRSPVFLGGAWAGCRQEREDGLCWIKLPAPSQD